MFIDEDPLVQVKFVHLFKVTGLNLRAIIIKPEIQLIIQLITSAATPIGVIVF